MRVLGRRERSLVLRDVDLVLQDVHLLPEITFVLEPSVGHTLSEPDLPNRSRREGGLEGLPKGRFPSGSLCSP